MNNWKIIKESIKKIEKDIRLTIGVLVMVFGISFSMAWFNLESFYLGILGFIGSSIYTLWVSRLIMTG